MKLIDRNCYGETYKELVKENGNLFVITYHNFVRQDSYGQDHVEPFTTKACVVDYSVDHSVESDEKSFYIEIELEIVDVDTEGFEEGDYGPDDIYTTSIFIGFDELIKLFN